jgi:SMC interacting uncharacterized protein involved in chromosome segregation
VSDKASDPAQLWQTMLAEMEKNFNAMGNQLMGSEQFSKIAHQFTGASVGAQKTIGDLMEKYLVGMNLPSRSQMVGMAERLQSIEGQLNEIRAQLNSMQGGTGHGNSASAPPRPPRTKLPPSATGGETP